MPQQYADASVAKSCKVENEYDKRTLTEAFIAFVDPLIRSSPRNNLLHNDEADLTDIKFQAESLSSICKDADIASPTSNNSFNHEKACIENRETKALRLKEWGQIRRRLPLISLDINPSHR